MPTLAETSTACPCTENGSASDASSRRAISTAPGAPSTFSQTTTNSSPPKRASVSWGRTAVVSRAATELQQRVAGGVPEAVVDELEAVEVEEEDGEGRAARRGANRALQPVAQQGPVRQLGEVVVQCPVGEVGLVVEPGLDHGVELGGEDRDLAGLVTGTVAGMGSSRAATIDSVTACNGRTMRRLTSRARSTSASSATIAKIPCCPAASRTSALIEPVSTPENTRQPSSAPSRRREPLAAVEAVQAPLRPASKPEPPRLPLLALDPRRGADRAEEGSTIVNERSRGPAKADARVVGDLGTGTTAVMSATGFPSSSTGAWQPRQPSVRCVSASVAARPTNGDVDAERCVVDPGGVAVGELRRRAHSSGNHRRARHATVRQHEVDVRAEEPARPAELSEEQTWDCAKSLSSVPGVAAAVASDVEMRVTVRLHRLGSQAGLELARPTRPRPWACSQPPVERQPDVAANGGRRDDVVTRSSTLTDRRRNGSGPGDAAALGRS